jgi:hypothetical protein
MSGVDWMRVRAVYCLVLGERAFCLLAFFIDRWTRLEGTWVTSSHQARWTGF